MPIGLELLDLCSTGSAHVEEGRNGCEAKCQSQLVGMVYMGEYSDACVCAASAAVAAGASGVAMQMSRQSSNYH